MYTLHLSLLHPIPSYTSEFSSFKRLKASWSSVSIRLYTTQSGECFRPLPLLFFRSTSPRLWREQLSSPHLQLQAAAVSIRCICCGRRGRSAWSLAVLYHFPAASSLGRAAPYSTDQPPDISTVHLLASFLASRL